MNAVRIPAITTSSQMLMWIPGVLELTPVSPKWILWFANWTEANHAHVYAPMA